MRQELLDVLDAAGPCAIAELAERLGRAPDSLYFHVRLLVRVGLVVEVERRKMGRHAFLVYDLAGRPLTIDRSRARRDDLQRVVGGILRLAARDYRRGLGDAATVAEGPRRNHWGGRVRGWLDTAQLARLNELMERLSDLVRGGRPGPGRQPLALAWVLAPALARRGARPGNAVRRRSGRPGRPGPVRAKESRRTRR
jgi:predicted ArsR family transcriptional regulator